MGLSTHPSNRTDGLSREQGDHTQRYDGCLTSEAPHVLFVCPIRHVSAYVPTPHVVLTSVKRPGSPCFGGKLGCEIRVEKGKRRVISWVIAPRDMTGTGELRHWRA